MQASAAWPLGERVESELDLRAALDVSASTFSNWKKRGVSVEGALKAEEIYGLPASWLRSDAVTEEEMPPNWMPAQHTTKGQRPQLAAQSQLVRLVEEDSAPLVTWETLVQFDDVPKRFRLELRDDSLAPDLQAGDFLEMQSDLSPRAGDIVLIRDNHGNALVRYLQERLPGDHIAHSPNKAFSPISLNDAGLKIVAVAAYETRRRRRHP